MEDKDKPYNDVIDHFNKTEGNAGSPNNAKINKLPKPLKFVGYIILSFFSLSILLMIIFNVVN